MYFKFFFRVVIEILRFFLIRIKSNDIFDILIEEGCWEKFEVEEDYLEGFIIFIRYIFYF